MARLGLNERGLAGQEKQGDPQSQSVTYAFSSNLARPCNCADTYQDREQNQTKV